MHVGGSHYSHSTKCSSANHAFLPTCSDRDPTRSSFGVLRVINDDLVKGKAGFGVRGSLREGREGLLFRLGEGMGE